jgi:hypothetical protein
VATVSLAFGVVYRYTVRVSSPPARRYLAGGWRAFLSWRNFRFLALVHMATVVLTLVFIPFGKFFHVIQRPASLGVEVYKRTEAELAGLAACRRCGEPLEARTFVADLEATMDELGLGLAEGAGTCPRCKRVQRGQAYLDTVRRGYR